MDILELLGQIIWIAAGLAIFLSVVLFFLPALYEEWRVSKHLVEYDTKIYEIIHSAMIELDKTGKPVTLVFGHEEDKEVNKETD
jgi:hypothetical protein